MKHILLLVFLGIILGQAGFCEENTSDPTLENIQTNEIPIEEISPDSQISQEEILPENNPTPQTEEQQIEEQQTEMQSTEQIQNEQSEDISQTTQDETDESSDKNYDFQNAIENQDIPAIYRSLEVPTHKYVHDLDPEEFVDTQNAAWSPYSLFRLTAPLYFKTISIKPGYYLLTPREHAGNWYMLFKESGKVKYIIPIYDKQIVPMDFYKDNLPEEKTTWSQRKHLNFLKFVGKYKSSQRPEMPKTYLEAEDLDDNFIVITLYWGDYKYYMVLRSIPM